MKKSLMCIAVVFALLMQIIFTTANAQEISYDVEFYPADANCFGSDIGTEDVLNTCSAVDLPEYYDSRDIGIITSVKDQGSSNSCWAFSIVAALEANAIKRGLVSAEEADFSEAHLVWFSNNPVSSDESDTAEKDGVNNPDAYTLLGNNLIAEAALARGSGIAKESDFPFTFEDLTAMGNYSENDRYNKASGVILESSVEFESSDIAGIKRWIIENGAVTAHYWHDYAFKSKQDGYYYVETAATGDSAGPHQITVIGWDDNFGTENFVEGYQPQNNGAWLCKNSYGEKWGNEGYFWISYEENTLSYITGFTVCETGDYFNNYGYSGTERGGFIGLESEMKAANVFTAKANEKISSVSTWISGNGVTVDVSVYTDIPDGEQPLSGKLAYKESFSVDNSGFKSFKLSQAVSVDKGEKYAVVISNGSSAGAFGIAVEGPDAIYVSNAGESFMVYSNGYTEDMTSTYRGNFNNFCIRAITECEHQYSTVSATSSTCTVQGKTVYECAQCGKTKSEVAAFADHVFGEWKEDYGATAVNEGKEERVCENCGHTQVKTTPMLSDNGYKVITIDKLFEMIFERISEFFRLGFGYVNT